MFRTLIVVMLVGAGVVHAQAPEPTGNHPRILLDDGLRESWKKLAGVEGGAIARAIARCEATRREPKEYQRDSYMGFDWSASAQACLISWVVRGKDEDVKSALIFVNALLDDIEYIGDKKGGENAIRRDTGYAFRSMPPWPIIAYDWLHEHPLMTESQKQRIVERIGQWATWYRKGGYHQHTPATNYHAGNVWSASLAAVAFGGEAGEFGSSQWAYVRDKIWAEDMAKSVAPNGILGGGDFPEGWQYAALSVAEYSLAARIVAAHGIPIDGIEAWLTNMFVRTMHARSGARDTIAVMGDTDEKVATIAISPHTLLAILIGPSTEVAQRQAAAEKQRLGLVAKDYFLFEALAQARAVKAEGPNFSSWPTAFYAPGTSTFYARTTWGKEGVWMASLCPPTPYDDADHLAPQAGNIQITRGVDEVLIDPTPYGSLSTLTTNAPTVDSKQLPTKYRPSQAPWSEATHFVWALQTATGVVAARCDYADQYKFQERSSDIEAATRDMVMIPWGKADASVVVIDRAKTPGADHPMHLRFRSTGTYVLAGDVATTQVGASTFAVHKVAPTGAKGEVRAAPQGACWDVDRGKCDFARLPAGEYRITIPGPTPEAIHVLDASDGKQPLTVDPAIPNVVHLKRGAQDAYVAMANGSYSVAPSAGAVHVGLDAGAKLAVSKVGDKCKVDVTTADGKLPTVTVVDAQCMAKEDLQTGPAAPVFAGTAGLIPVGAVPNQSGRSRKGCCDAGGGAGSGALAMLVLAMFRRRRR